MNPLWDELLGSKSEGYLQHFPFRGAQMYLSSRHDSQRCQGEEQIPLYSVWKGLDQKNCSKEEVGGEWSRNRTGRADEQQYPSPVRSQRASSKAECFALMFIHLPQCLPETASLRPDNSTSWLQIGLAPPGLSVELLSSPDRRILTVVLTLMQAALNTWVVSL